MPIKISIIIVSYNTAEYTVPTIKSVLDDVALTPSLHGQVEIIMVDNNSQDDSVAVVKKLAKQSSVPIKVIENKTNAGFATANNQGIAMASGDLFLLLNSDTLVQPHALGRLVAAFDLHPKQEVTAELATQQGKLDKLGILAASLVNPDGTPQPQGGSFPGLVSLACHMLLLDDIPLIGKWLPSTQHTGHRATRTHSQDGLLTQEWVGGTAMVIKRTVVEEIGPLDQNIFMYGEDVEFCLRASQHHWDIALHPQAKVVHYGSASGSSERAIMGEMKGYLYIWAKHKPLWQVPLAKGLLRVGALLRWFLFGTMVRDAARAAIYRKLWLKI